MRNALDRAFRMAGVIPNCVAEVDALSSALSLVKTGVASAIVPKGDFSDVPGYEGLRPIVIDPPIYLTACLISSAHTPLTSAAEAASARLDAQVEQHFREALSSEWERVSIQ